MKILAEITGLILFWLVLGSIFIAGSLVIMFALTLLMAVIK